MKKEVLGVVLLLLIGMVNASELRVTQEHPFLVDGEWVPASQLEVGDELTTLEGFKVIITSIKDVVLNSPVNVYNLEAGIFRDFVVEEGLIVHNSDAIEEELDLLKAKNMERLDIIGRYNLGDNYLKYKEDIRRIGVSKPDPDKTAPHTGQEIYEQLRKKYPDEPAEELRTALNKYQVHEAITSFRANVYRRTGSYPSDTEVLNHLKSEFPKTSPLELETRYNDFMIREKAIEDFITESRALIYSIGKKHLWITEGRLTPEMESAAMFGALIALQNHNPEYGGGFLTYLGIKIKGEMSESLHLEKYGTKRIRGRASEIINEIDHYVNLGISRPTKEAILQHLQAQFPDYPLKTLEGAYCRYKIYREPKISFDSLISSQMSYTSETELPEYEAMRNEYRDLIQSLLKTDILTGEEAIIVKLWMTDKYTFDEISQKLYELGYTKIVLTHGQAIRRLSGSLQNLGALDLIRFRLKYSDLKFPKGHALEGQDMSLSILTDLEEEVLRRYHGVRREKQSFAEIEESIIREYENKRGRLIKRTTPKEYNSLTDRLDVRRAYSRAINRLKKTYDLDIKNLDESLARWKILQCDPSLNR